MSSPGENKGLYLPLPFWHIPCNLEKAMRLLKDLLTFAGAGCIGWALPNLIVSLLPVYGLNNFQTVALNSLLLGLGIFFFVMGYGVHRRAMFAWVLGCVFYTVLIGYFFWRVVAKLELNSYFVLLALIGEWPFAALWWRYAKLHFGDKDDELR